MFHLQLKKKSILYISSAKEVWKPLETRFALTNGSWKYKLNKELYELKQCSVSINKYYTTMSMIWEEIDSMNTLPTITSPSVEMTQFIEAISKYKEESRLFQFLNGLNETYGP